MNITDVAQEMYQGTMMTKMTAADEEKAHQTLKEQSVGLRSDVQELLDRYKKNISCAQAFEVENFLHRY